MSEYRMIPVVHPEVIDEMTPYEVNRLMDELEALLQNQQARVEVSQEKGFPYLWRVLIGKQRRVQQQITVDQTGINTIMQKILRGLWKSQVSIKEDTNSLQERVARLERIVGLQNLAMMQMRDEIEVLGGNAIDMRPVETSAVEMFCEPAYTIKMHQNPMPTKSKKPVEDPFFAVRNDTEMPAPSPNTSLHKLVSESLKTALGIGAIAGISALASAIEDSDFSFGEWRNDFDW